RQGATTRASHDQATVTGASDPEIEKAFWLALPREVDTDGARVHGVERMDERLVRAAVQRVSPGSVLRRHARDRRALHCRFRLALVDDRPREQPACMQVICSHAIAIEVLRG